MILTEFILLKSKALRSENLTVSGGRHRGSGWNLKDGTVPKRFEVRQGATTKARIKHLINDFRKIEAKIRGGEPFGIRTAGLWRKCFGRGAKALNGVLNRCGILAIEKHSSWGPVLTRNDDVA
jgi:hypothetical protein